MNLDPILYWNEVALEVHRRDFTVNHDGDPHADPDKPLSPEHGGPTRTTRALAIVHLAMYGAYAATAGGVSQYPPLAAFVTLPGDASAAVAAAAICSLTALYKHPAQREFVATKGREYLNALALTHEINGVMQTPVLPDDIRTGIASGDAVAVEMLRIRATDNSDASGWHVPGDASANHRSDPYDPGQGYLDARWGKVKPFCIGSNDHTLYLAPHPAMGSAAYMTDFNEVKVKGVGLGMQCSTTVTAATRTADETVIGIFWGYDGARGLGTPPRLYNQCVRKIAQHKLNSVSQNARLFALINAAQADAGIIAWGAKYHYNLWRPVLGIREHDIGFGPSHGASAGAVQGDPFWGPLGAPQSNNKGAFNRTPNFPAYPSGHATFGATVFELVKAFYGGEDVAFSFVSDELNGKTLDPDGSVRSHHTRELTASGAIVENALSRVYLGVHWRFDGLGDPADPADPGVGGVAAGTQIAAEVFANYFKAAGPPPAPKADKRKAAKRG